MSGLVRGLLFGVGFGDQTFGDVPLGFRGFGALSTSLNLGKSAKSGAVFTGQRCVPHPYTMTQNEGAFCNGWIGVSFQTCKKMCWKNEIPEECTIKNPPGGCAYAVWHDNANHPGWCHLGQIFN